MDFVPHLCDDCLHPYGWHHQGFGCEHPISTPKGFPSWCQCKHFAYEREQVVLV